MTVKTIQIKDSYATAVVNYLLKNVSCSVDEIIKAMQLNFDKTLHAHKSTIRGLKLSFDVYHGNNTDWFNSQEQIDLTKDVYQSLTKNPNLIFGGKRNKEIGQSIHFRHSHYSLQTIDNSLDRMSKIMRMASGRDINRKVGVGNGTTGSHRNTFKHTPNQMSIDMLPFLNFIKDVKSGSITTEQYEKFCSDHKDSLKLIMEIVDNFKLYPILLPILNNK